MKRHVVIRSSTHITAPGRHTWKSLLFAATCLLNSPSGHAQSCVDCAFSALPASAEMRSEWSIKKEVNEVNLFFVASEGKRLIGDLSQDELTIRDDRKAPAAILGFHSEKELPLRIGLLVDTSDSLKERFRFEQSAASAFLRQALSGPKDQAFVLGFSGHDSLMQDFTQDTDLLARAVSGLKIGGGTALYDAVRSSCEILLQHPEHEVVARVLVILSDGQNNSGRVNLAQAIDVAQRAEVTVYTVSTASGSPGLSDPDSHDVEEGNRNLRQLAEETGGRVLFPTAQRIWSKPLAGSTKNFAAGTRFPIGQRTSAPMATIEK
ncbi:MAG: VWA domain-containing protein [Terriglobales bacterium]